MNEKQLSEWKTLNEHIFLCHIILANPYSGSHSSPNISSVLLLFFFFPPPSDLILASVELEYVNSKDHVYFKARQGTWFTRKKHEMLLWVCLDAAELKCQKKPEERTI